MRVDDNGIEVSPGRGALRWSGLAGVKLRYFAIRRRAERERGQGRRRGWMQLVLKGDDRVVRIDSRLGRFRRRPAPVGLGGGLGRLHLDPVTRTNFEAAGVIVAPDSAEERCGAEVRNGRDRDA